MTDRSMTQAEIERADAAYRQQLVWLLTLGLLGARPERQAELEAG